MSTRQQATTLTKGLVILGLFFFFLLGIQLLGDAFKLFGKEFATFFITTTENPFFSLFVGVLATVLVQSSSVTTSMVVGLVSAGTLTIPSAVPMIMGANIGTSVTNSIVSTGHISRTQEFRRAFAAATIHDFFNIITVAILLPLELATGYLQKISAYFAQFFYGASAAIKFKSPVKAIIKPPAKALKNFLLKDLEFSDYLAATLLVVLALTLIFLALFLITKTLKTLMLSRIERAFDRIFSVNAGLTMFIGMLITMTVQSSSITTSIMVPMAATGILSLVHAFPLTLGANIGTTVTAMLAALTGNLAGLTIAFVHLFFNITGIILVYPVPFVRNIPIRLAEGLAMRTSDNKKIAIYYIVSVFFLIPLLFMFLSRIW